MVMVRSVAIVTHTFGDSGLSAKASPISTASGRSRSSPRSAATRAASVPYEAVGDAKAAMRSAARSTGANTAPATFIMPRWSR
jgi:hypothetical protein